MPTIRVLHVATGLDAGGVGKMLYQWYRYADPDRVQQDVAVVTEGLFSEPLRQLGCRILTIRRLQTVGPFAYIRQIESLLASGLYDVVHSHVGLASPLVFAAAIKCGVPLRFLHAHTNQYDQDQGPAWRKLFIWLLKRLSVVFATDYCAPSIEAAMYVLGRRATKSERFRLELNGLDLSEFSFNPCVREQVRRDMRAEGKFVIGCVARLYESKNQAFLLRVFRDVVSRNGLSELWLVGDGPDYTKLNELSAELGIEERVRFVPSGRGVAQLMQGMDVFVLPSKYEGLGMVVIEAQVSGLHCIVSTHVPPEVDLTGLVSFLPLNLPPKHWATRVLREPITVRRDFSATIRAQGYDIITCTNALMCRYEEAVRRIDGQHS